MKHATCVCAALTQFEHEVHTHHQKRMNVGSKQEKQKKDKTVLEIRGLASGMACFSTVVRGLASGMQCFSSVVLRGLASGMACFSLVFLRGLASDMQCFSLVVLRGLASGMTSFSLDALVQC